MHLAALSAARGLSRHLVEPARGRDGMNRVEAQASKRYSISQYSAFSVKNAAPRGGGNRSPDPTASVTSLRKNVGA
jgi:predicted metalloenzyme YecM